MNWEFPPPAVQAARMSDTYENGAYKVRQGYISEYTWRWYRFFWVWTAPRFSSLEDAERRQDRAYMRLGATVYRRRFDRVNALRDRLARSAT
jgi:hypothetical protein